MSAKPVSFELQFLPFRPDALWPLISPKLLALHWEVLHAGYLSRWQQALKSKRQTSKNKEALAFNRSGAVLHDLWWANLGANERQGSNLDAGPVFCGRVGEPEHFEELLIEAGLSMRGGGWVCLSAKKLDKRRWEGKVHTIQNHDYPWQSEWKPLLLVDLWEHSYWPDQVDKAKYLTGIVQQHLNWRAAEERLEIGKESMLDRSWLFEERLDWPPI